MADVRPIDANAMHKFVEGKVAEGKDGWANGVPYEWAYALTAVDMQPTLDYAPVVHGKWRVVNVPKRWGGSTLRCSECNTGTTHHWSYCPNCGAKMDGGKENE